MVLAGSTSRETTLTAFYYRQQLWHTLVSALSILAVASPSVAVEPARQKAGESDRLHPAPPGWKGLLIEANDPRGKVLRPSNFTLSQPNAGWSRWHSAGYFKYEQTYSDFGSYVLTTHYPGGRCPTGPGCDPKRVGQTVGCQGSELSALHHPVPPLIRPTVVPIGPNRRYMAVAVVRTSFPRFTTEVNLRLFPYDSSGNMLNSTQVGAGLPSNTSSQQAAIDGWIRFEWEIVTPWFPNLAGGALGVGFTFGCGDSVPGLGLADFALVEMPLAVREFNIGDGLQFAGGVGGLQMDITACTATDLTTTSAHYHIEPTGTVTMSQRIDFPRILATWRASPGVLRGLRLLHSSPDRCVLGNSWISIGVQSDGLLGFVPHNNRSSLTHTNRNVTLTLTSFYGGDFNRLTWGHLLSEDDFGGLTVSPDPGRGSGRLPRWTVLTPGLKFPKLDPYDRNSTPADAAGWQIAYELLPGERLFVAAMPVRQYDWEKSFSYNWWECPHVSAGRELSCNEMLRTNVSQAAREASALVLWEAAVHANGGGWEGPYVPYPSSAAVKQLVGDVLASKKDPVVYMSMWFSYTRNATVYINHVQDWKTRFGIRGIYSDGLPICDWLSAYEEARMLRQLFPDGTLIFHDSQEGREESKAAALYRPFIHAYATSTLMGENTPSSDGVMWRWPRYATAGYRRSGSFGAIKGNRWTSPTIMKDKPWQSFVQLVYNGRQRPASDELNLGESQYLAARLSLQRLWEQHGRSRTPGNNTEIPGPNSFFDQYYLPAAQNLTQLMIGRSPMPIAVCTCEESSHNHCNRSSGLLHLRTMRPLITHAGDQIGLRYTIDSSEVTSSSTLYRGPLRLSNFTGNTVVRAVSFEPSLTPSRELTWRVGDMCEYSTENGRRRL